MQKMLLGSRSHGNNDIIMKICRFFKVGDTLKENLHIAPRIFEKTTKNIEIQMVRFHKVIIEKSCEIVR